MLERVATTTANSTVTVSTTANNTEDTGGATGWSVGNNAQKYATAWAAVSNNSLQVEVKGEAVTNSAATGTLGIVDQANPDDTLTTVRPGMTLQALTSDIMDDNGLTTPNWMYQWAHWDGTTSTDISEATSSTYLVKESDIGKALLLKVTFTDDLSFTEGPLQSSVTHFVGPLNLIVSNTGGDTAFRVPTTLTATIPKFAQSFVSGAQADSFTLDFIELIFSNISDTATVSDAITVTLNEDSSGSPGEVLCTLANPATFSASGAHVFLAPSATIRTLCPLLEASNTYHVVVAKDTSYTETVSVAHHTQKTTDPGSAFQWTSPDAAEFYTASTSAWADHANGDSMLIDVRARPDFEPGALTETEVPFGWGLTPTGIVGGQPFRLLFLTDDESPTSTDIDVYNEFVQAQAAAGHADIQDSTPASSGSWAAPPPSTPATTPRRRPQTPTHLSTG